MIIRRLTDAKADLARNPGKFSIKAVIRSTVLNQDGRSASFTAPNGSAQRNLLISALQKARISAADVSYIETHGTGTALGDPIEWGAIRDVLLEKARSISIPFPPPLVFGAVKTNIGHLEGAAGMAGLIKAVMCLQHKAAPKNLHLHQLNPLMDSTKSRNAIFPTTTTPLTPNVRNSLFASVSSFGSGGTNAHVILER